MGVFWRNLFWNSSIRGLIGLIGRSLFFESLGGFGGPLDDDSLLECDRIGAKVIMEDCRILLAIFSDIS